MYCVYKRFNFSFIILVWMYFSHSVLLLQVVFHFVLCFVFPVAKLWNLFFLEIKFPYQNKRQYFKTLKYSFSNLFQDQLLHLANFTCNKFIILNQLLVYWNFHSKVFLKSLFWQSYIHLLLMILYFICHAYIFPVAYYA